MTPFEARVELRKVIRASKEKVFRAWGTPELLAQWMAPGRSAVLETSVDFRVGGRYRIRMRGEMNGRAFDVTIEGAYERIVPDEELSFTLQYQDEERRKRVGDSLVTVLLKAVPEGTELTLIHSRIATEEGREGHRLGWTDSLEKLEALVSR